MRLDHWIGNDEDVWGRKEAQAISDLDLIVTDYVANGSFASLKENVTLLNGDGYAYFMRNTDLKTGSYNVFVPEHSYRFLSKSALFGGEVIISNVGDVGSVHRCPTLDKPMTLGNNEIMVKGQIEGQTANGFLYLLFSTKYGQHLIDSITGGSVQRKFNKTDFRSIKIPLLTREGLEAFNRWSTPIFATIDATRTETQLLKDLRDTLLPKLMSGEIDVSKIDLTQLNSHLLEIDVALEVLDRCIEIAVRTVVCFHAWMVSQEMRNALIKVAYELS